MRTQTIVIICSASLSYGSIIDDRLLDAIAYVESSNRDLVESPKGARGRYQIMKSTWEEHSNGVPFSKAFDPEESRKVAYRYLNWIDKYLERKIGKPPTRDMVICCYNGGIGRFCRNNFDISKMPRETRQYVEKLNRRLGIK